MEDVSKLLELTDSDNKKDRKQAVIDLGNLDNQYQVVMDRLKYLEEYDNDKGVRKECTKAIEKLSTKPLETPIATEDAGQMGTGFDDEIGDSSLKEGQYDVESNLPKSEEDRREMAAAGKGIIVTIKEQNRVNLEYDGNVIEKGQSTGTISVMNSGTSNRISGVDLVLRNTMDVNVKEGDLEKNTRLGMLRPGSDNAWKKEYTHNKESEPIKVIQEYIDPETGNTPSFLVGSEKSFDCKITLTNTTNNPIYNIRGTKNINELASIVNNSITRLSGTNADDSTDSLTVTNQGSTLTFEVDSIKPNGEVQVVINLNVQLPLPQGMIAYRAGKMEVKYDRKGNLDSGLEFESVDGVSDIYHVTKRQQRETEPGFYDCEILFENLSEFVYNLNRFTVFANELNSQEIVLDWDGTQATEDEREIVPSEKMVFEFAFESRDEKGRPVMPQFGSHLEFSVYTESRLVTETVINMLEKDLLFMALEVEKAYLMIGEDGTISEAKEFELPSYIETPIPTLVRVKSVGTSDVEGLILRDQIPQGFSRPENDTVALKRNGLEVGSEHYETDFGSDPEESNMQNFIVNVNHLEETDEGGLKDGEEITLEYTTIAMNPEPQTEAISTKSIAEGFIYLAPESKVKAVSPLEELRLIVIHKRDTLGVGKKIKAIDFNGSDAYQIELQADNTGTSVTDFTIVDLIPEGFQFLNDTLDTSKESESIEPESSEKGAVHGWKFKGVQPGDGVSVKYIVTQDDKSADPRKLQSIYKG